MLDWIEMLDFLILNWGGRLTWTKQLIDCSLICNSWINTWLIIPSIELVFSWLLLKSCWALHYLCHSPVIETKNSVLMSSCILSRGNIIFLLGWSKECQSPIAHLYLYIFLFAVQIGSFKKPKMHQAWQNYFLISLESVYTISYYFSVYTISS